MWKDGQGALGGLANQDFARHTLSDMRNPIGQILGPGEFTKDEPER
jgi:hypothetical protein